MQVNATPILNLACTAALAPYLRVKRDATYGLAVAGATDREIGTLAQRHIVSGLGASAYAAVVDRKAPGTVKMVAAGVVTQWAIVYGAASGKVSATANANPIGLAVVAAGADGDYIEVLRGPFAPDPSCEAHTEDDTLTAAENGSSHTNVGAEAAVTLALPAAVPGLEFFFQVGAAQELRLDPNGTETISLPSTGVAGAAGKYLTANAAGETVHIKCVTAGTWAVFGYTGTWTAEG